LTILLTLAFDASNVDDDDDNDDDNDDDGDGDDDNDSTINDTNKIT
jgi:hypothetical protein